MKPKFLIPAFVLAVVAGGILATLTISQRPAATPAEIAMAESMGISVEELKNQTPEEHMRMMRDMMQKKSVSDGTEEQLIDLPDVRPTEIVRVNDGDLIELNPTLVKKQINGKQFAVYGYNEQIPGPIIVADEAATIRVSVTNNIDSPTTVHWHGVRLDNSEDGVPDVTQEPIEPGASHLYSVKLPDEGVYWYHPHVREDIQQDMGLYGNLLVMPIDDESYPPVNRTETVVLDDLLLNTKGERPAYGKEGATYSLMGRFGNVMLINGKPAEEYSVTTEKGAVVRYYFTNVANTRTFKMTIPGAKLKLIGSDIGKFERESFIDSVTIAPAERYIVDAYFEESGDYELKHQSPVATYSMGTVHIGEEPIENSYGSDFAQLREFADVQKEIDNYRQHFDDPVAKTLRLTIDMMGMNHGNMMHHEESDDGIEWEDSMPMMNEMMSDKQLKWKMRDDETQKENMDIAWNFSVGDIVKIRIINDEDSAHPMHHPIHFHGQRFLILNQNGDENTNLAWKDTVLVPKGEYVDLLFDMSNPGDWMFHCHIAEHLTNGMMGMFRIQ